ncbi:hypothetical protein L3Y34_001158 [Caenorhabditis briggsae]|uniref:Uncharacterized protein n=2 Tax=Caenorhabditis briggsae TaxID=6238 RepID=A0AAE9DBB1_CAEBR|nr:hypothetical protein L3Y34_001158 [Caenorhabditis briggsae]
MEGGEIKTLGVLISLCFLFHTYGLFSDCWIESESFVKDLVGGCRHTLDLYSTILHGWYDEHGELYFIRFFDGIRPDNMVCIMMYVSLALLLVVILSYCLIVNQIRKNYTLVRTRRLLFGISLGTILASGITSIAFYIFTGEVKRENVLQRPSVENYLGYSAKSSLISAGLCVVICGFSIKLALQRCRLDDDYLNLNDAEEDSVEIPTKDTIQQKK